jgi:hypothetical protein
MGSIDASGGNAVRVRTNWVQSLFAEARAELGRNVNPLAVRRKAEDMLSDRHFRECDELASGRNELFPDEVRELHAQEWDEFEKFAPIRPDGRTNIFLVKNI